MIGPSGFAWSFKQLLFAFSFMTCFSFQMDIRLYCTKYEIATATDTILFLSLPITKPSLKFAVIRHLFLF